MPSAWGGGMTRHAKLGALGCLKYPIELVNGKKIVNSASGQPSGR